MSSKRVIFLTKDRCLPSKSNQFYGNIASKGLNNNNNEQFNSINLNKNNKPENIKFEQSKSTPFLKKSQNNNGFFDYKNDSKNALNDWKKNDTPNFHECLKTQEMKKEYKWETKEDCNKSTLSLHLESYDNLIEIKNDTFASKTSFDFLKQQNKELMNPEIMQFKTSQKLLNSVTSMLRISNRLHSSLLLFRQTRNFTRRLGVIIPQRGILLLEPQSIAPQARFIHASRALFSEIVEVHGPAFAESISEGDIRWIKQKGDYVKEDELVAEIETDKTSVEVPAQFSGTIVELLVEDGARVTAKQKLYKLQKGDEASSSSSKIADAPTQGEKADAKQERTEAPVKGAPKAPEAGSSDASPPSKPKPESSERVDPPEQPHAKPGASDIPVKLPKDLIKTSKEPLSSTPVDKIQRTPISIPKGIPADQAITGSRSETRVKANRMRQRIAQRLKDAQNTYAMLTTFNEIDMSNIMEMRTRYQKDFMKKHGIKLGLMSPFIRASAYAMTDQPIVNAVFDETEIVYRQFVDISIAVATPKGLVVPVLRNVEGMDYAKIELSLAELGEKARDGKLAVEDMEGGTFTISNGGVFGSMFGTPIINPPQSAILGMHGIFDRPVAINGKVEIRPMMYIALTYDHRLIDGREAVTFLKKIKSSVEDPRTILMNL